MARVTGGRGARIFPALSLLSLLTFGAESKRTTRKSLAKDGDNDDDVDVDGRGPRTAPILTGVLGDTVAAACFQKPAATFFFKMRSPTPRGKAGSNKALSISNNALN
jgi:hypothetical protein